MTNPEVLIVEDGDEYLRFFSRHVDGYEYKQARSLKTAREILESGPGPVAFVLDLRFDRVAREDLIGDVEEIAAQFFAEGEADAAWRYLVDNQGYLILRELRDEGYEQPALIIAELPGRRQDNLRRLYGNIGVVASFEAAAIKRELERLLGGDV
jgi:hypothetical protein